MIIEDRKYVSIETKLVSLALRGFCLGADCPDQGIFEERIDWDSFKKLLVYHQVAPFLHLVLKNYTRTPADIAEFLKNSYYTALSRCSFQWQKFMDILLAFSRAEIEMIPIKGVAFLEDIYRDYPARPMSDIDILVKKNDLARAEFILGSLGFGKELFGLRQDYWRDEQYHLSFTSENNGPLLVELHWALDYKRRGIQILPRLWERTRTIQKDDIVIRIPSPEDSLMMLALHLRRFGNSLALKNVLDAILIVKKNGRFDWGYLIEEAERSRLKATVYFLTEQMRLIGDDLTPQYVMKQLSPGPLKRKVTGNFILKNTFSLFTAEKEKEIFLKSQFFLYESIWEPVWYIIGIPQEQFAKFYNLEPYKKSTAVLYKLRFFYMLISLVGFVYHKLKNMVGKK